MNIELCIQIFEKKIAVNHAKSQNVDEIFRDRLKNFPKPKSSIIDHNSE